MDCDDDETLACMACKSVDCLCSSDEEPEKTDDSDDELEVVDSSVTEESEPAKETEVSWADDDASLDPAFVDSINTEVGSEFNF